MHAASCSVRLSNEGMPFATKFAIVSVAVASIKGGCRKQPQTNKQTNEQAHETLNCDGCQRQTFAVVLN